VDFVEDPFLLGRKANKDKYDLLSRGPIALHKGMGEWGI
jgi:hypothetical protein